MGMIAGWATMVVVWLAIGTSSTISLSSTSDDADFHRHRRNRRRFVRRSNEIVEKMIQLSIERLQLLVLVLSDVDTIRFLSGIIFSWCGIELVVVDGNLSMETFCFLAAFLKLPFFSSIDMTQVGWSVLLSLLSLVLERNRFLFESLQLSHLCRILFFFNK